MGLRERLHDLGKSSVEHQADALRTQSETAGGDDLRALAPRPQRDEQHRRQGRLDRPAPPTECRRQPVADERLDGLRSRGRDVGAHAVGTIS